MSSILVSVPFEYYRVPRKFPVKEEVSISRREGAGEEVIIQYPFVGAPSNYVSCAAAYEQVLIPPSPVFGCSRRQIFSISSKLNTSTRPIHYF